jgi:ATP-dependent DNA ligase
MFNFSSINKPTDNPDWNSIGKYDKFIAEPKFDGVRMLAEKKDGILTIHRESDKIKNSQFPEILGQFENMPDNTIYDGELCILSDYANTSYKVLSAEFSEMQKRINLKNDIKINFLAGKRPSVFMAFDCVKYKNTDIREFPLHKRRSLIDSQFKVQQYNPEELLAMVEKNNMEGIVVKDPNGTYNSSWLKFKNFLEKKFKVVKINSADRNIASLEVVDENGKEMGSVNWTLPYQSDEIAKRLIGMTVDIRHMETSKGKLRFPSLQNKDQIIKVLDNLGQEILI